MARKTRRPLTLVGAYDINLDNQSVSYSVKRSNGARYARLEIRADTGLTLVIPRNYSLTDIPALLDKKKRWILNKLDRYKQLSGSTAHRGLKDNDKIPYLGRDLEIKVTQNHQGVGSIGKEGDRLLVNLPVQNSQLGLVIAQWYKKQAFEVIKEKVEKLSARFKLVYNRLTIRSQRTRWGSCSYSGNLNFNWKLIMAPEPVVDYVIIHELFHLQEMNHGKGFWKLVAEQCPRWHEHKKWLREHEAELAAKLFG